ncbi:sigma-70 family RNA polymerase sigma factor [Kangiella sp. HZ709]|uniref:sigma-70 family RNA polymerase sigma factor n=1 Tax=Kangiella sp. HZ709 TaxID=2666328 RepID=UPI0012AFF2C2|nr:sigma-70 family RNA polymerase sigma factor [Kangiella sp. HZ709]MRX26839.1 sigma-70 family RNA polymerase sigma factor [Kangiella sp. HZ709]
MTMPKDESCPKLLLWTKWKENPTVEIKHKLFDVYAEWSVSEAKFLYNKYRVNGSDLKDYIHYATIALLESIERYNSDLKIPFEAFAIKRLKGEILDNVATFTEKTHHLNQIRKAETSKFISFINRHKKNPTEAIVELTVDLYLLELLEDQNFYLINQVTHSPYNSMEFEQLKKQLLGIIDSLEGPLKILIQYHYYYQWSFVEIAEHLGLTRGRVSQMHKLAIQKLKEAYLEP